MPSSDETRNLYPYAVIAANGLIERMGLTEEALIPAQAVEPGQMVVTPLELTGENVIVASLDGVDDDTHRWNFLTDGWSELPPKPEEPHYWDDTANAWITYPERPNDYCEWNGSEWVETRSQAEYDGALHHKRMQTVISTGLAIHKFAEAGAYPLSEIAADQVGIPATIREFIDLPEFPQLEKDLMLAYFKTMPTVPRSMTRVFGPIHPDDPGDGYPSFVPWLASEKGVTISPELIDSMWNVPVPPPLYEAE